LETSIESVHNVRTRFFLWMFLQVSVSLYVYTKCFLSGLFDVLKHWIITYLIIRRIETFIEYIIYG